MAMASAGLGGVVRGLYLVAMAIFVLTVGIGILNAQTRSTSPGTGS